jgi:cysteine desulfurase
VAGLIGAGPGEIGFTGSGSEADLLALRGAVLASGHPHPHVITQATEHPPSWRPAGPLSGCTARG